tara:strand:- start:451 stop:669 length:219 start_codon:yes stop_codon:yes gene_type:complete
MSGSGESKVEIDKEARKYEPFDANTPRPLLASADRSKGRATRGGRPYQAKMEKLLVEGKPRFSSAVKTTHSF